MLRRPTNARFPPFRCRWLVGANDWLANYGTTATEKIELDHISTEERSRQLFAVYGWNFTRVERPLFRP